LRFAVRGEFLAARLNNPSFGIIFIKYDGSYAPDNAIFRVDSYGAADTYAVGNLFSHRFSSLSDFYRSKGNIPISRLIFIERLLCLPVRQTS
jgi:hypothetical protein